MRWFAMKERRVIGFDQASMKRYGIPWRFKLARKSGAAMQLEGKVAYPFAAKHRFFYLTGSKRECLDRSNAFATRPLKVSIANAPAGQITVTCTDHFRLFGHEFEINRSVSTIRGSGNYFMGFDPKRFRVISSWSAEGRPMGFEPVLASPFAVNVRLKCGRYHDLLEVSCFAFTQPPAPDAPYYAPMRIHISDAEHMKIVDRWRF